MERKIGERFEYEGVTLEVCPEPARYVGSHCCEGCYFFKNKYECPENELKNLICIMDPIHPVIFKEVTK
jgi:hypothetical protein